MKTKRNVLDHTQRDLRAPALITRDLGYCCLWKFLSLYKDNEMIADRLGVSSRTIRRYRAAAAEGEFRCEDRPNCMKCRGSVPALPKVST